MRPAQRAHVALQARLADCLAGKIVSDPREVPYYRRILGLAGGPAPRSSAPWPSTGSAAPSASTTRSPRRTASPSRRACAPTRRSRATRPPRPSCAWCSACRFDGGLLASLERPAQPPRNGWRDPVDLVLVRWGAPGKHEVHVGRDWRTPAPDVEGEAQTIGED